MDDPKKAKPRITAVLARLELETGCQDKAQSCGRYSVKRGSAGFLHFALIATLESPSADKDCPDVRNDVDRGLHQYSTSERHRVGRSARWTIYRSFNFTA